MNKKKIPFVPMTEENFKEYGVFISSVTREPDAENEELRFWNKLGIMNHQGDTSISIVETYGRNGLVEKTLERHKETRETLIPMAPVILVAALSDKAKPDFPDLSSVKAFSLEPGSAVTLFQNTWHHAPLSKDPVTQTFVIFDSETPETDLFALDLEEEFGFYYTVE